jgi:uncharacterized membrane protein
MLSLVSNDLLAAAAASVPRQLPLAAVANLVVALLGYRAGTVTVSGVIAGAVLGSIIFLFTGAAGWFLLLLCFGGRRGAGNAIANTGVAAVAGAMSALTYAHVDARLAFVAALVAGASDTVASEVGKAWGRRTFLVTTARLVPAGTSGAMSLEGTAAGVAAAALLAAAGYGLELISGGQIAIVVIAATIGALVESALGATLEERGVLNNDLLNFINTAVAALVAVQLWQWQ